MLTSFWSMKGGEGASTAAALAAAGASAGRDALLVDLGSDQTVLFTVGNQAAGIGEWSRTGGGTWQLEMLQVRASDTLSVLTAGRIGFKWGAEDTLVDWLRNRDRPVIVDAGTLDPFERDQGDDKEFRRMVVEASHQSLVVTSPTYQALRKASLNKVWTSGAVVVETPYEAVWGAGDVEDGIGAPVVAAVPHFPPLATQVGRVTMVDHAWTEAAQDLRTITDPEYRRESRVKGRDGEGSRDWCPWLTAADRAAFADAASWAVENRWGAHVIDADTGEVELAHPPAKWSLAAAATAAHENYDRPEWRRLLCRNIAELRGTARALPGSDGIGL